MIKFKEFIKTGFSFGLTSGLITTLGVIIGLYSSTQRTSIVIGGILSIAIADSCSDALAIHMVEEVREKSSAKGVWISSIATLIFKFFFAVTFLVPILLFNLHIAIVISILWAISLITVFNYYLARQQRVKPLKIILEHILIAFMVVLLSYYAGVWIKGNFGSV